MQTGATGPGAWESAHESGAVRRRVRTSTLPDTVQTLERIATGVCEILGFGVAAFNYLREDGRFEVVAVVGSDEARATLLGVAFDRSDIERELAAADHWGALRFVPHGRVAVEDRVGSWVPDIEMSDAPDAWHPEDALFAPMHDEAGAMIGVLSVDLPANGLRPDQESRTTLEHYVRQAERVLQARRDRQHLADEVRVSHAVHAVMRSASSQLGAREILANSQEALVHGFQAETIWLRTLDVGGDTRNPAESQMHRVNGEKVDLSDALLRLAPAAARVCWRDQRVAVVSRTQTPSGLLPHQEQQLIDYLRECDLSSLIFVPVGSGTECLGYVVMCREADAADWTDLEVGSALEVGRDLGRALVNARVLAREQQLVRELTDLDAYKSQLISTISHELKAPLTSIVGHTELLEAAALEPGERASLEAIGRGANRLGRIVEDLLLLSDANRSGDELRLGPVDLRRVVGDTVEVLGILAVGKDITLSVQVPEEPVSITGTVPDLETLCTNLISNAVKYTPAHGSVSVVLSRGPDEAVLCVTDDGIGISGDDQERLFREFFRSSNPAAQAAEGTGLGLAIVHRIVERGGGRIDVRSAPGQGSAFEVALPLAEPAPVG